MSDVQSLIMCCNKRALNQPYRVVVVVAVAVALVLAVAVAVVAAAGAVAVAVAVACAAAAAGGGVVLLLLLLLLLLLVLVVETKTAAQHSCHMLQVRDFKGALLGIGSKVWRDVSSWTSCRCGTQVLVGLFLVL